MDSIKRWLDPKKSKSKSKSKKRPQTNLPFSGNLEKLTPDRSYQTAIAPLSSSRQRKKGDNQFGFTTTTFMPQERGRDATIALLNTGTPESLAKLLTERDHAAKQVRRGPKTKGTTEVQLILRKPSCKAVEKLYRVRQQAEVAVRYSAPAVVAYNFSRSLRWNQKSALKLPSLQLRAFGPAMMREIRTASAKIPAAVPFAPIDWLVLPTPTAATQGYVCEEDEESQPQPPARCWSPVSEPGGWRDGATEEDIAALGLDQ
ncbi:hypothetical protein F5Y19DRAFT_422885 [Xylariaceae sp. FL1651]|nr:hypothetical protein F5Y19DRAFT_422885 [Xylariaceae sp. FL1651]